MTATPRALGRAVFVRYGRAGVSFGASKAAVFLVPLLLSNLLDRTQYGVFEYAYGVGSLASTVLVLGLPAAIPAFLLQRRRPAYASIFRSHLAGLGCALIPLALAYAAGWVGLVVFAAGVLTATIGAQAILSSHCKTTGLPAYASLAESGVYLVILLAAGALAAAGRPVTLEPLVWGVLGYAVILAARARFRVGPVRRPKHLRRRYGVVLSFGLPIVFSSFLMLAVTSSGRLLVGTFLIVGLPEVFRGFASARMLVFGLAMMIMMVFRTQGILPAKPRSFPLAAAEAPETRR